MRPASEGSQVRHERRQGPRYANRVARQARAWVPRGSTVTATPVNTDVSENGRESNPSADRRRPNGGRRTYVVRSVDKEVPENSESGGSSVPLLVQEIQDKLAKGTVECMICYDMVRRSAAIWSCSSCFSIFHLHCIKKWARAPTSIDLSVEKDQGLNWRCPGCQSVQLLASKDISVIQDPARLVRSLLHLGLAPAEKRSLQEGALIEQVCRHVVFLAISFLNVVDIDVSSFVIWVDVVLVKS
ncbi:hypothetical protein H6P81_015822 [Aristolochia fimbriata]|uniref:PHD-type domain-containing protein n=1 Tax=Aristolochia fimbriata TaxID=158543 RepID=A0AAV7E9R1_ARIFI|nr:hypothetical protein H6P81_015822 [Aristolochia fimbriata]